MANLKPLCTRNSTYSGPQHCEALRLTAMRSSAAKYISTPTYGRLAMANSSTDKS